MLRLAFLACVVSSLVPGRAEAGGGFLPPLEIEVGGAAISTREGDRVPATQLLVGISWASVYPRPTPVDVSLGVISTFAMEPARAPVAVARMSGQPTAPSVAATGGFLDLAVKVDAGRHWRTWAGFRGELMGNDGVGVLGGAARVSAELWAPVSLTGRGGGILGAIALAGWAELGVRERPDRSVATVIAAGVGFRLPLVVAARGL